MRKNQPEVDDRRKTQRFQIKAPLTISVGDREVAGFTRDLSNRGVFFYVSAGDAPVAGEELEFVVELPPEITLSSCCFIRCRGRAVRTENAQNDLVGMAVEILDYSILREPVVTN